MHITQIEIDNFKSFGRKSRIPFLPGFTIISGPNGSGKSNIIDSILFCLALSSSRHLRAERLTDLLNLNSDRNIAEVEITFSDGTVIKRRIKRTENTYYNYLYLNGRSCRQGELLDFLSGHGIVPHGYNVVMQGDINRIIEMSDTERRKIIDEIAGVAEFDTKKDLALGELSQVKERISEESVHLEELNVRLSELVKQKEQAVKYRSLQDELKYLTLCRSAARLAVRKKEHGSLVQAVIEDQEQVSQTDSDISWKSHERDFIKAEIAEIDQKIAAKTGSEYMSLVSRIAEAKASIDSSHRSIDRAGRDKDEADKRLSEIFAGVKKQEERVTVRETDLRSLMIDRTNLSMTASAVQKEFDRISQSITRETHGLEEDEALLLELRTKIHEHRERRGELLHQQDILIERSRMRSAETDRLTSRILSVEKELEIKREDISALNTALLRLGEEKREYDQRMATLDTTLYTCRDEHERLLRQIRELKIEIGKKEAQQQIQGRYSRAMEAVLGMEGVYGTIGDLASCKPDYATAMNVAAGGKIHFVVVETDQIAADAIRYLQEHKLGRVTFLPLNKIRSKPLPLLPSGNDVIGYAIDLLEYDPKFDTAFRVVLGSTLVIDSLDHARKRIGTFRMVTPDGAVVEPSGSMTGGSTKKESGGFGTSSVDEIKELSSRLSSIISQEQVLAGEISERTGERDEVQKRRLELEGAIVRAKGQIESVETSVVSLQSEVESLTTQRKEAGMGDTGGTGDLAFTEAAIEQENMEISQLQSETDRISERLSGTGIPLLYEQREESQRQIDEVQRRLSNKEQEISETRMELSFAQKKVQEERQQMDHIRDLIKRYDDEISEYKEEIKKRESEIREAESTVAEFSKELEDLRINRSSLSQKADEFDVQVRELIGKKDRILLKIESLNEKLAQVKEEIETLSQETGDIVTDLSEDEIEIKIGSTSVLIEKLGDVNMRAIEEYEQVDAVVRERKSRIDILQREMSDINERIEFFSRKKFEAFFKAFEEIDKNFREIFSRLTMGTGELKLENPEDPFTGGLFFTVQPRDKKVHHLNALSGGEKSLTTLAFIFSIQKVIPAPFYAFDEVDMNLDGSNVVRIADMIKELSNTSQFINISLRKPMIDAADRILGVTIRPDKTTLVTGVTMDDS
ncbi:MAG: chromosome segregation protein SMC [Methanomicrobiales archaeon]|nr:chromosome segregation protein SMC [Methanomicrobiales archaeon]